MNKNILVVDDIANNRLVVKRILQDEYTIIEKEDAEEALKFLRNKHNLLPDLIILDLNMPGMGGEVFAPLLRSLGEGREEIKKIPILIHSAYIDKEIVKTMNMNVSGFLSKPVDPDRLEEEVHKILGKK